MLSPSDYNSAVPKFTNGNYASNPLNPLYIEEPASTDYNRGVEPLQTLPAQWWNWFINQFTARFNKLNVYVNNIFNELAQLLSIGNITPDGTEASPTITQVKDFFQTCYPEYVKTSCAMTGTYVPQTTMVNGHALSDNVTITRSDLGLGTSATVNTGTASGCIPTVGTALGTTDGQFLATDASGNLKPSGYTASCFRASTWTPTTVTNANMVCTSAATASVNRYLLLGEDAYSATCCSRVYVGNCCKATFNPATGVLTAKTFCGDVASTNVTSTSVTSTSVTVSTDIKFKGTCNTYTAIKHLDNASDVNGEGISIGAGGLVIVGGGESAGTFWSNAGCTAGNEQTILTSDNAVCFYTNLQSGWACAKTSYIGTDGAFHGDVCGLATCASKNGSGTAFGTAATCAATAFRSCTWYPDSLNCGCVCKSCFAQEATCLESYTIKVCRKCVCQPSQAYYCYHICICTPTSGLWVLEEPPFEGNCGSGLQIGRAYQGCSTWKCIGDLYIQTCLPNAVCCVLGSPRVKIF